jgi:nucleotide-binding universal stress UspA family protein
MPQPPATVASPSFRRILFASNFSLASAAALPYAVAFARRFRGEIIALHVVSPDEEPRLNSGHPGAVLEELGREAESRIRSLLAAAHGQDLAFRVVVEGGEVASVLSTTVEHERIDLVVAGSEGRHGIQKVLSPPVDEEIAETAHCPVLLVGPESAPPSGRDLRVGRLLHPTDFNPHSTPVIQHAYALAAAFSAQISFLHIADNVWTEPLSTRMTAEAFCRMRMLENGLPEHSPDLEPAFLVEFGPPEQMILETSDRIGAGLILMGVPAPAHPLLAAHFPGPLAYDIASHARCPVLVLRNAREPAIPAASR